MKVDESAPVVAMSEIEIEADPEVVWEVLTAIDRWPSWNPDVKSVSVAGEASEGLTFRWKAGGATITSTIRALEPFRLIGWTGKTFGVQAVHVWRLEPRGGRTLVMTEESWQGLLPRLLRGPLQKRLKDSIDAGLRHMKAEAQRRSA